MTHDLDRFAAHGIVERLVASLAERPGASVTVEEPVRRAAILLALREREDGEPELLMIKRADAAGDPWSGHIACPGGRMESGDHDLAATAIRETWEETGIDVARDGRMLGQLDELQPRSPMLPPIVITPFVAIVRPDVAIRPSPEVAAAFWVPVSALRDEAAWGMGLVTMRGAARRVSTFQHGEHTVWGLTERVLRQLLAYLGMPVSGVSVDDDATGSPH